MTSKTIALTGAETKVEYFGGANVWLRNDGTSAVYASATPGVAAGADGVVSIPAGQSAVVYGACGTVYLLGTGSVMLVGSDYAACPFKTSAQASGSGADEVARAAIEAHAGSADIHVTADDKNNWNGKADKTYVDEHIADTGIHVTAAERADWSSVKNTATIALATANGVQEDLSHHLMNPVVHVTTSDRSFWDAKADKSAIPAKLDYVNYLGYINDVDSILNNANYAECSYECIITTTEAAEMGLPSCWWQVKYLRHTDNNGFGCQIAFPIDGPDNPPRYRTSAGTEWSAWKLFCDGGNAASVGTYTEEKLTALEARVAALEAKVEALEGGTA